MAVTLRTTTTRSLRARSLRLRLQSQQAKNRICPRRWYVVFLELRERKVALTPLTCPNMVLSSPVSLHIHTPVSPSTGNSGQTRRRASSRRPLGLGHDPRSACYPRRRVGRDAQPDRRRKQRKQVRLLCTRANVYVSYAARFSVGSTCCSSCTLSGTIARSPFSLAGDALERTAQAKRRSVSSEHTDSTGTCTHTHSCRARGLLFKR